MRPEASVLFSLFDSKNLFKCLHPKIRGYEPHVRIVVEDSSGVTIVKGFLEWNGTKVETITETINNSLPQIIGERDECQRALNFDPPWASNFDPPQQSVFV